MSKSLSRILVISLSFFLTHCYVNEDDGSSSTPTDDCATVAHSFSTDVVPIFSQCSGGGCHDATSPVLSDNQFQNIQDANAVDTTNPENSSLLRKPLGEDAHGGGVIFTGTDDDDYVTILCWITDGAQDD